MKIAVITPYHTEPLEMLKRAHDSVTSQTHACTHYMVADGHPRAEIDSWTVRHIALPVEHSNNGNTPRAIGSLDAIGDGFDAISYLDADNWFEPDHIAGLVALQEETKADLVSSGRVIHAIDGSVLLPKGESGDGQNHADTSVLMFYRSAFAVLPLWGTMPHELGPKCDHFIFKGALALGCTHNGHQNQTVHFTSRYSPHYRKAGLEIPDDAKAMHSMKDSDQFARRLGAKGLSHILSGHSVESWFQKKATNPKIFVVPADEDTLTDSQHSLIEDLEARTVSRAEVYFADETELLEERALTDKHNNVFLVVFEEKIENRTIIDAVAEERGDMAIIYVRTGPAKAITNADSLLDRRAWKVILPKNTEINLYKENCRYGYGHIIIADEEYIVNTLIPSIETYTR